MLRPRFPRVRVRTIAEMGPIAKFDIGAVCDQLSSVAAYNERREGRHETDCADTCAAVAAASLRHRIDAMLKGAQSTPSVSRCFGGSSTEVPIESWVVGICGEHVKAFVDLLSPPEPLDPPRDGVAPLRVALFQPCDPCAGTSPHEYPKVAT